MEEQLKLTALPVETLVKLLRQAGSRFATIENVQKAIDARAPTNENGTLSLITFGAWLIVQRGEENNG